MAMRRPRVKVAANLSIRRPSKQVSCDSTETKPIKVELERVSTKEERRTNDQNETVDKKCNNVTSQEESHEDGKAIKARISTTNKADSNPCVDQSAFKLPKPVEDLTKVVTTAPIKQSLPELGTEEPHSPRKMDSKFAYINTMNSPRKRIRTESMTSNKSYSEVSLKSRKTIKQEETQKASDAKRDLRKRLNNIQNVDKQSLTMFDMIYYNPIKNPMKTPALTKKGSLENIPSTIDRESRSVSKSRSPTPAPTIPRVPDPPKLPAQLTPQLKLGPNGEMILDETSLVVENEREKEIRDTLAKTEIVYDDEFSGNSGYYSRFKRTRDWLPEETIRFYRCLHTIGTDFSMMIQLFPDRSRRDLKLKFKKEERLNLMLVNKALLYPKEFNIEELKSQFEEEDEEMERRREVERQMKLEAKEKLKMEKSAKKLQVNQSKNRNPKKRVSRSARAMLDGERINETEPLLKDPKPKRRKRKIAESESVPKKEPARITKNSPIEYSHTVPDNSVNVENFANSEHFSGESDIEDCDRIRKGDAEDVPYVPNADFAEFGTKEASVSASLNGISDVNTAEVAPEESSNETPLDIEAMDIDIVDAESKSVYEIKAEPKIQSVQLAEETNTESTSANVITLQNLDDQTQTTVEYQEPDVVDSELMVSVPQAEVDSVESKYYDGCDVVYIPMPANAPIAHPVKAEMYSKNTHPATQPSPPVDNELHPVNCAQQTMHLPSSENRKEQLDTLEANPNRVATPERPIEAKPQPEIDLEHEPKKEILKADDNLAVSTSLCKTETDNDSESRHQELETADEPRGLGPLEDIDINSLVLVESQDTTDPAKTIYEIYVIDPETGKLSEKPLDVPEDVIENIRSILEVGEG